jgi:hypothetical protein
MPVLPVTAATGTPPEISIIGRNMIFLSLAIPGTVAGSFETATVGADHTTATVAGRGVWATVSGNGEPLI